MEWIELTFVCIIILEPSTVSMEMLLVAREEVETLILLKSLCKDVLSTGSRAEAQVPSPWILSLSQHTALTASALIAALGWPDQAICPSDARSANFCLGISHAQMTHILCAVYPRELECHLPWDRAAASVHLCAYVCGRWKGRQVYWDACTLTSCLFTDLDQTLEYRVYFPVPISIVVVFVFKSLE